MIASVWSGFPVVVPAVRAWTLFACYLWLGAPAIAEVERAFDGVDMMSAKEDAAYHREKLLDMHNYLRSREAENGFGGGAVFMNRLLYDVELEAYARNYARYLCSTGKWEHSQRQAPLRVARGENLYTTTADYSDVASKDFDSGKIVQKWWDEREYFDWHSSNPSQAAQRQGKLVGHWTQVVRAEASTLGCWIVTGCHCQGSFCGKQNSGRWSTYVVCHYDYGNLGYYPYWPLNSNIQYRIPSSVSSSRRQRCGNCPKGFSACGTTIGGGLKRDAYLCVGHWNIRGALPPANLLQQSIQIRRSSAGVPSWYYMVRNCVTNNGSCPANSSCWKYDGGKALTREPPVLVNQCQCRGFSTSAGIYFERDFCGRYSAVQPYYDADAFLGFSELKVDSVVETETSPSQDAPTVLTSNRELSAKFRPRYFRHVPSEADQLQAHGYATLSPTPPLMEEAEQAGDLLVEAKHTAPSVQSPQDSTMTGPSHSFDQGTSLVSTTYSQHKDQTQEMLCEADAAAVHPPSDDLMFEWRGVPGPLSIAQWPAADAETGSSQSLHAPEIRLQGISMHNTKQDLAQVDDKNSLQVLPLEHLSDEPATEGLGNSTGEEPADQTEDTDADVYDEGRGLGQDTALHDIIVPIPDGELQDDSDIVAGAPVDIPAVQRDARDKRMTTLEPSAVRQDRAEGWQAEVVPSVSDEMAASPTLAGEESTESGSSNVTPQDMTGIEVPYSET